MVKKILFIVAFMVMSGCAVWTFEPVSTTIFVNDRNEYIWVDNGRELRKHTLKGVDGRDLEFTTQLKVRVELQDGTRFVAYQEPTNVPGVLYKSSDGEWEFFELEATGLVARREGDGYVKRFEGVLCSHKAKEDGRKEKVRSRTDGTRVLNSPYERLDDTRTKRSAK